MRQDEDEELGQMPHSFQDEEQTTNTQRKCCVFCAKQTRQKLTGWTF